MTESDKNINVPEIFASPDDVMTNIATQLDPLRHMHDDLAQKVSEMQRSFELQFAPICEAALALAAEYKNLKPIIGAVQDSLASEGWFLGWSFPMQSTDFPRLKSLIDSRNVAEVVEFVKEFYQTNFKEISNRILGEHPNRQSVLDEAVWAHEKKKYSLSTVVFLSQADGILKDANHGSLFEKKDRTKLRRFIDGQNPNLVYFLLAPFERDLPLFQSSNQRGESFVGLNRHQTLHGEVLNYGTEDNSLRAFSFLDLMSGFAKADRQFSQ